MHKEPKLTFAQPLTRGHHLNKCLVLLFPVLYIKFQRHRPISPLEEVFFTIYGHGGHIGHLII